MGFDFNGDTSNICKICGKYSKGLGNHIIEHKVTAKEYYDKYIRKENEGKCLVCGKDTKFKTIRIGYIGKYCSLDCHYIDHTGKSKPKWKENRYRKIKQFELDNNCTFANDLRKKYGNGWYSANIINFIFMDGNTKFVPNTEIEKIKQYSSISRPNLCTSRAEQEINLYIKSFYNKKIILNSRKIIRPKEIDIYLPDIKLAIEYNGGWYHSIDNKPAKDYHLKKSLLCREKGIRLIHIYEFEDLEEQKQLLKDLILGKDNYPKKDFNKNNLIEKIPKPEIIYNKDYIIYGAGKLY